MTEPGVPAVVVVVVTHNSARHLPRLLASLPAALNGLSPELIVVDNDSVDDTRAIASAHDGVRLVEAENLGYAAGINTGVRAAIDTVAPILVLNPDIVLEPGSVPILVKELARDRTGIVVPRVADDKGLVLSLRNEPTIRRALGLNWTGITILSEYVKGARAYSQPGTWDWALGAVMLVRREGHDALGGWDESFFLYSEETDFCLRARDRGYATRFVPDSRAYHSGGGSGRSDRTHAMQVLNRVRLYGRRHSAAHAAAYWAANVASEASWVLRGRKESRAAVTALVRPAARPRELQLRRTLIPK